MTIGRRWPCAAIGLILHAVMGGGPPLRAQSTYGGPNILSRSLNYQGRPQVRPLRFHGFIGANGFYTDGLTSQPTSGTELLKIGTFGAGLAGGVYGVKVSRRSQTTVGYSGSYNITRQSNSDARSFSGADQSLVVSHERQLTRRWGFFTSHSAGTQNSVLRARSIAQQGQFRSPFEQPYTNYFEPLDTRLYYINSNAGFSHRYSRRLAFSMDGGVFSVQRSASALASVRGARAQGEISYELSPHSSLSLQYSFNHFHYRNSFGESRTHGMQVAYARRLSNTWSFSVRAGPYRAESERLQTVPVDPFIASLTGQASTVAVFYDINNGLGAGGAIYGSSRVHSFSASFDRSINPGNGITLTGLGQTANVTYGYSGIKRMSIGANGFWSSLKPILDGLNGSADFGAAGVGGGMTYRLTDSLYLTGNAEVARVLYLTSSFRVTRKTASVGIAFSPGDIPLRWR